MVGVSLDTGRDYYTVEPLRLNNGMSILWTVNASEFNDTEVEKSSNKFFTIRDSVTFDKIDEVKFPIPVYTLTDKNGEEIVQYNSNSMEKGKLYKFDWKEEKWALKKTDEEIEFHKWVPESKWKLR